MSTETERKSYTMDEVREHKASDDRWIVYNGKVYDVTQYVDEHPGGEEVIVDCAGEDATDAFNDIGHSDDAHDILKGLLIGDLEGGVTVETKGTTSGGTSSEVGGLSPPLMAAAAFVVFAGIYFYLK